jgi:hypothetical protein
VVLTAPIRCTRTWRPRRVVRPSPGSRSRLRYTLTRCTQAAWPTNCACLTLALESARKVRNLSVCLQIVRACYIHGTVSHWMRPCFCWTLSHVSSWNEPLMGSWAKDTNTTPGFNEPVPLFNELALAVGAGLRNARLPNSSTPPALLAPGATFMSNDVFLASFAQSGVLPYLAGFSVHPYRDCQWPERALPDWQRLRAILDEAPGGR